MHRSARLLTAFVSLLCLIPALAPAAVISIRPEQLKPQGIGGATTYYISPFGAQATSTAYYWAPIRLPVGARVTKLRYYHHSLSGSTTMASLHRVRMGQYLVPNLHPENSLLLASCNIQNTAAQDASVVDATAPANPESDLVVRPGFTYFVAASTNDSSGRILGIRVYYTLPAP